MNKIPTSKKIISNLFYYSLDLATITIFGYIFWILMGKFLVPEQYGILQTIVSIFYILVSMTTLGFHEALIKFIPELLKQNKREEAESMTAFSIKCVSISSLIFSVILFIFSDNLSLLVYNSLNFASPLKYLAIIVFLGTIFTLLKFIMQGFQQYKKMFILDLMGNVGRIIVSITLLYSAFQANSGILGWGAWYAIFILFSLPILKFKIKKNFDKKKFYHFAGLSVLSLLSLLILTQINVVILSFLSTFEAVAFYGVAFLFGQIILFIPNVIIGSIFPNISELWIENKDHIKHLIGASIKLASIIVLPIIVLFSVASEPLIKLFYTESYISASKIFPFILIGSFLNGLATIFCVTLYSIYKPKIRLKILFFGAIINTILSFILIPIYNLTGAGMAFIISQTIVFFLSLYFANKNLSFEISKKSFNIIPIILLFTLILYFSFQFQNIFLRIFSILVDLLLYLMLITKLHVMNRNDLFILEIFPNKFGFGLLKRIARKLIT